MKEQIKVKLMAEMVISGTQEEVERFKYVVGLLVENPTGVDDTLRILAALLGVVQDYVSWRIGHTESRDFYATKDWDSCY